MDLARVVTREDVIEWRDGPWSIESGYAQAPDETRFHVVAYDFGVKHNILRLLVARGCKLTLVPATTCAATVMDMKPDGYLPVQWTWRPRPLRLRHRCDQ